MKILFSLFLLLISFNSFCQYDAIKPQGVYSSNFTIDEKPRSITYYMPSSYGKQDNYPLLIVLHAEKSDAASVIKKYGDVIQAKADSEGCIVLYPDAYKGHWNGDAKDTINDVGFINIMAEFFLRQFDCNLSEIRFLGIGTGGNICYRAGCESIYKPVAIATVNTPTGNNSFLNCSSVKAIPALNISSAVTSKADINRALTHLFSGVAAK